MKNNDEKRFERVYDQTGWTSNEYILVDRETGVQYLAVAIGQGAGLTVLVDADGKPLLYKGEARS